jgi:nitrite reductase/ring-hydroxylating ferredoxin subunit
VHLCSLPPAFYTSAAVLRREHEVVFGRQWLYAGHTSQLTAPGDFLVAQPPRGGAIVLLNEDAELRAFPNACRHRGHPICEAPGGNASRLVCPFHGWTYDLEGRLVLPPFGDVERLPRLALEVWRDWIFVCMAEPSSPLCGVLAGAPEECDGSGMTVVRERTFDLDANWKFALERPLATDAPAIVVPPSLTHIVAEGDHVAVHTLQPLSPDTTRWTTRWFGRPGASAEALDELERTIADHLESVRAMAGSAAARGFPADSLGLDDPEVRSGLEAYAAWFEGAA